jgi:predicted nuclease with TOPRIM domain
MSRTATVQDIESALAKACASLNKNMLKSSDIQSINNQVRADVLRDLRVLHSENQAVMKQSADGRAVVYQRISNLESNLSRIEQMLKTILEQQSRTSSRMQKMQSEAADSGYLFQRI